MPIYPKQDPSMDENCQQKGGGQPQPMDEDGEGSQWSQLMWLQEYRGPMCILFKHTPIHEQVSMCNAIELMEVE
jgi:hypothetical protein